jgi:hypothetical protein
MVNWPYAGKRIDHCPFMLDDWRTLAGVFGSLLLCSAAPAGAGDSANPYQQIVTRNVFGLKPSPASAKSGPEENNPPPKITLTGVTDILGKPQALFSVTLAAKPGEQPKSRSFVMGVGEREDGIEVLAIDVRTDGGTVEFDNQGTLQTLSMDKNAPKLTASGVPAVTPAAPRPVGYAPPPTPGGTVVVPVSGMKSVPTRSIRLRPTASPGPMLVPRNAEVAAGVG